MIKKKGIKISLLIAGILFGLLILLYFIGVMIFTKTYFFHTVIDGENVGLQTPKTAEERIRDKTKTYQLSIVGREDMKFLISADDLEMENVFDGSLERLQKEQNPFLWVIALFQTNSHEIEKMVRLKEDKLDRQIKMIMDAQGHVNPVDAYISEYEYENKRYRIVEEEQGTALIYSKTKSAVMDAVLSLDEILVLEEKSCYKEPAITKEDPELNKLVNGLNEYLKAEIYYDWNGSDVIIDADVIKDWLVIKDNKVTLDEELIQEKVTELSRTYDTFGRKRMFKTSKGDMIEIKGGAYGWRVRRQEEAEELTKLIRKGAKIKREPVYLYTAYVKGQDDIGDSYVEIDLGNQHLYLYSKGELILESDLVSGDPRRGYQTPTGIYGITYKERNATLRGENYRTPVNYWMPFNGNIGMHDAGWRQKFGENVYQTNGSHGCVNLPKENAELIYSYVETNFPVICYE